MNQLHPTVRYLILCEDIQTDSDNPRRVTLIGLISAIHSLEQPPFPLLYRELCVFLRTIPFGDDPLEVNAVMFRIRNCQFQEPGLYWVQFWYNEQMIAQQALLLR
jgi:hypothetical protein